MNYIGKKCSVSSASYKSMKAYNSYRFKFTFLTCPCKISPTEKFEITDDLGGGYFLIQSGKSKLSVIYKDDLVIF